MSSNQNTTLEDAFAQRREYWMTWVDGMSTLVKTIDGLQNLQVEVYARRQEAVENYHNLNATLARQIKAYKEKYNEIYNKVRLMKIPNTPNYVYNTEGALRQQVEGELAQDKYIIDIIENHINYMDQTIKTIDSMIYNITNRIKIEEIRLGK
jgi:hypothetical protein